MQMTIVGVANGQRVCNVLHFEAGVDTDPDPLAEAIALADAWSVPMGGQDLYLSGLPESYGYIGVRIKRVNNGGGPTYTRTNLAAGNRAGNADFSGAGPVGLLHCDGGAPEPEWHTGKIFYPSVSIEDVENNIFVEALKNAIIAFITTLMAGIGIGAPGPFKLGVLKRSTGTFLSPIGNSVSGKVGTQRRRYLPI
jgi:hypothetical protein